MQEHEVTLPDYHVAEVNRWLATEAVLAAVATERLAQHSQWGHQDLPIGGDADGYGPLEATAREQLQRADAAGHLTYAHILLEEVYEALAVPDSAPDKQADELTQVAAVAVKMVELIRERQAVAGAPAN